MTIIIAITVPDVPRVVRLVRSIVLCVREEPYIEGAIAAGTPVAVLLVRHVLPNTIAPLVVLATYIASSAVLVEAGLSFLGAGLPPEVPSWGNMIAEGRMFLQIRPELVFVPGAALALTVLGVNVLGDGLRDELDPRMRHRLRSAIERRLMSEPVLPVLSIEGLTVALPSQGDRRNAVENVSLSVKPGEILCVVGESGSGKSVIAQTVMGLLPRALRAVAGSVRLIGEDVLTATPERLQSLRGKRMSMIFQEPMTALNPVMKVGHQIAEVLHLHGRVSAAGARKRVLEIMGLVNLPEPHTLFDTYPHHLSGGQRQRVMIAAALALEPALLIADEPTTALDVTTQAQILKLIKRIQKERGTAVIFITRDFGVVADVADRVAVMRRGLLVEEGRAAQVLQSPQHSYTKALIAAVPSMVPKKLVGAGDGNAPILLDIRRLEKVYHPTGFFGAKRTVNALRMFPFTFAGARPSASLANPVARTSSATAGSPRASS